MAEITPIQTVNELTFWQEARYRRLMPEELRVSNDYILRLVKAPLHLGLKKYATDYFMRLDEIVLATESAGSFLLPRLTTVTLLPLSLDATLIEDAPPQIHDLTSGGFVRRRPRFVGALLKDRRGYLMGPRDMRDKELDLMLAPTPTPNAIEPLALV
jgi:hypothetical protein